MQVNSIVVLGNKSGLLAHSTEWFVAILCPDGAGSYTQSTFEGAGFATDKEAEAFAEGIRQGFNLSASGYTLSEECDVVTHGFAPPVTP